MKKQVLLFTGILLLLPFTGKTQTPYTLAQFAYDSIIDVVYGTATDYAGNTDTLKMDIYKPLGDQNCKRPIAVVIHGGAWVAGSKNDINTILFSRALARRGYVVANINYRLGTHKASNYVMYAVCNTSISAPCAYICDSAEILRANFRGMQDAKGAIRYMKSRNIGDSTDIDNVYLIGESAGGFVALAAAFTDQASEKPAACFSISNAPQPDNDMNTYGCIPSSNDLSRPDLGSIDGTLHTGLYDATVKGVASIYGGVLDPGIFQQLADTPVVYLYHQGSDVVVHYNYGQLLGRTSWECYAQTNLCQTYYFYPRAWGGEGIRQYFVSLGSSAPLYQADIVNNYQYMNDCFANGHSIDNFNLRMQNTVDFFAAEIAASGNTPAANCLTGIAGAAERFSVNVFPVPAGDQIRFSADAVIRSVVLTDISGRTVAGLSFDSAQADFITAGLPAGVYFADILTDKGRTRKKILIR